MDNKVDSYTVFGAGLINGIGTTMKKFTVEATEKEPGFAACFSKKENTPIDISLLNFDEINNYSKEGANLPFYLYTEIYDKSIVTTETELYLQVKFYDLEYVEKKNENNKSKV